MVIQDPGVPQVWMGRESWRHLHTAGQLRDSPIFHYIQLCSIECPGPCTARWEAAGKRRELKEGILKEKWRRQWKGLIKRGNRKHDIRARKWGSRRKDIEDMSFFINYTQWVHQQPGYLPGRPLRPPLHLQWHWAQQLHRHRWAQLAGNSAQGLDWLWILLSNRWGTTTLVCNQCWWGGEPWRMGSLQVSSRFF